ncbi:ATP-grasp domain-containing protein [Legionella longbeachae]|uniref:ATP-grasp domain-containing protein n=1 Tax=Legionella longbeachae serogroup 1 (strain NSW150) TaxID=661367 RepID=D3HMX6_LEGLN|nr:ATP-grasp domain-containing protein [Legionella longbeachae]VEE04343.1 phosphoribosylglycinamide synthetase ATP-grasp (A) domain protein [Legionella oakridgensis]ARB92835.1 ATP-grasp domain-containing protein [Legionella longbeachae]QIN37240.1 ATP-grasp domain-containing protein [Legionella longbeachae]RZV26485.1 ATP-grasp domain-containing protein [Legionella longbeachae]UAK47277.1 ATP-grasp domain-containing protein [Legionella longbeachae]
MEAYDINSSPCLLVIGAREHTLQKLKTMNIRFVLIQSQHDSITTSLEAQIVFIDTYDNLSELSRIAKQLHQIHHFRAVVSFTEFGLYPAALIAKQLNIRGNAVFPVKYTRDKFKMRSLLKKHQLDSIAYQRCTTLEDVVAFYTKINAPFILKPTHGAGSQGVCYVDSLENIPNAWDWAIQHGNQELIAEEYLLGKEYSVESLSLDRQHQVIAITAKLTTGFPHFIELGHHSPAKLTPKLQQKIQQLILRFLDIIQHLNGPAHTEIKVHKDEIKIIESQTRMGGDQIWELTELTTGVDTISKTVLHLLGLSQNTTTKKANAAAVLFFAREFEEILDIHGLDSANNLPGIVRIDCTLKKGQKLGKLSSSLSRQGYILGTGSTIDEAISSVSFAMEHVQITTKAHID